MLKPAADLPFTHPMPYPSRGHGLGVLRPLTFLIVVASVILLIPDRTPADLNSAVQRYNDGQHEAAIAELVALAKLGNSDAKYTLGIIYTQGQGIPANEEKALKWLGEAASEGNFNAQYSLGIMHATGKGVPQDKVVGLMWLNLSGRNPSQNPYHRMKIISVAAAMKKEMTPEQIAEADRLAAEWNPSR